MEYFFQFFASLSSGLQTLWHESFLIAALKFFLAVYTLVLILDIFLVIYLHGVKTDIQKILFGRKYPLVSQASARKRWAKIEARLDAENPAQYKVAVLEADDFVRELLAGLGFEGANMTEQLDKTVSSQVASKETLRVAHEMRNRIVHEPDLELSREDAERLLGEYRKFFEEIELLSA